MNDATVATLRAAGFDGVDLARLTEPLQATTAALPQPAAGDRQARLVVALDLAAAHLPAVAATTVPGPHGGAPLSFLSFRSHAEGFLASTRDPAAARRALEDRYQSARSVVDQRVAAVIAQVRGTGPVVSGPAATWFDAVRTAKPAMAAAFAAGRLSCGTDEPHQDGPLRHSAFHRVVHGSPALLNHLGSDPGFLATRLLTTLLYLGLHRLGLPLVERYFLCHAVARACETVFEVDANGVLAGLTTARPRT